MPVLARTSLGDMTDTLAPPISAAEFMATAPRSSPAPDGSSPWASEYARELRGVVLSHAAHAPRSLQRRLGPSELGHACDRQVVGKMAGLPRTNHVADPWPSIMGTAGHLWMDGAFTAENARTGARWLAERKVQPWPGAEGSADLYDALRRAVTDHKFLGATTMAELRRGGPPLHYRVQLKLYGLGYRWLGLPVDRVVIAAWPRTGSSIHGLYVWEHALTPADDVELEQVFHLTEIRRKVAERVARGELNLGQVPATPEDNVCYYCPFYRPESARDGAAGCPGTVKA